MTETPAQAMARACPGCGTAMRRQGFARKPLGAVDLDLCLDCQAIWFDAFESTQLTPGAVIDLFRVIEAQRDRSPHPLAPVMRCVSCRERLVFTHDIELTNRIVYYRCPAGHGRFTTFLQFLREKNFVRSLTPVEVERLRATVTQVRCSSCGAPVDIANDADCPYCHAPISILDADAVRRTLDELDEKEKISHKVDPSAVMDAVLEGRRVERRLAAAEPGRTGVPDLLGRLSNDGPIDLVHEALAMLTSAMPESP